MTWYVTMYPNYWGRGESPEESKKEARRAGGRGRKWVTQRIPDGSKGPPWVDQMGTIRWEWVGLRLNQGPLLAGGRANVEPEERSSPEVVAFGSEMNFDKKEDEDA